MIDSEFIIEGNKKIQRYKSNSHKDGYAKLTVINPCIKCINCSYNRSLIILGIINDTYNLCEVGSFKVDTWDTCKQFKYGKHGSRKF